MIRTIRTTVGRENAVIDALTSKAKNSSLDIRCIFYPAELKGYIFLEGDEEAINEIIKTVPHVKGIIKKDVMISDIKKFLEIKKIEIKVNRGDVVEIVAGPFKNEKGKVTRVDEAKEELTIELLDAAIPIPITIPIDSAKVIEVADKGESK
ncbi:transcription elongation factor Spt5 [Candidatus Micrarchaeota archaeon RBG_16_36_9]|nr:MAG: transcription elongation factor Spt5 [Candidatus Micrarchaeota archaeon RBG_16_36_9]